jgi:hypothetical protein
MKPKRDEKTGRHIKGQKEHKTKRGQVLSIKHFQKLSQIVGITGSSYHKLQKIGKIT